jgi:glutathione peroxidase-family protein
METNKPKEMFHEDTKAAEFALKNSTSMIMCNYHSQFTAIAGMYVNFFSNMAALYPLHFPMDRNQFQNRESPGVFSKLSSVDLGKKYKENISSHLEASKNLFKSIIETNKKMMDEAHSHFNFTLNEAQAFLGQGLKTGDKPLTEEDAYANESGVNDTTIKTGNQVNDVKDLKNK